MKFLEYTEEGALGDGIENLSKDESVIVRRAFKVPHFHLMFTDTYVNHDTNECLEFGKSTLTSTWRGRYVCIYSKGNDVEYWSDVKLQRLVQAVNIALTHRGVNEDLGARVRAILNESNV